jgi:large subunit ribosomal protein L18
LASKKVEKIRIKRKKRVRGKIFGTEARPRLSIFRSSRHIYVQAIADDVGRTLVEASTLSKEIKGTLDGSKKIDAAKKVGNLVSKKLKALGKNLKNMHFSFLSAAQAAGVRQTSTRVAKSNLLTIGGPERLSSRWGTLTILGRPYLNTILTKS